MRKTALVLPAFLNTSIDADAGSLDEKCKAVGDLAYSIVVDRQGGIGLSKMIEGFSAIEGAREMILDAHEWPRYRSNENVRQSWDDFRDEWTLKCYKSE